VCVVCVVVLKRTLRAQAIVFASEAAPYTREIAFDVRADPTRAAGTAAASAGERACVHVMMLLSVLNDRNTTGLNTLARFGRRAADTLARQSAKLGTELGGALCVRARAVCVCVCV
jgi:hypothetical protein